MKFRYLIVFTISFIAATGLLGQKDGVGAEDYLLNELFAKRDFLTYFRKIDSLSDVADSNGDTKTVIHLKEYLRRDFGHLTSVEKLKLRMSSTYMGNNLRELGGHGDDALEMYLIAHQNVYNKYTLDSLSWYIENKIANIYTAKDEYEKAEYFSSLLERSLKHYNMSENLSRYYTNKGRRLKSEAKIEEAIAVFERGYSLADSIGFEKGVFVNALNFAELYNEYPEKGEAEFYLIKCDSLISKLKTQRDYLENLASLDIEKGTFHVNNGRYNDGVSLYNNALDILTRYYSSPFRREFAKLYRSISEVYLLMDSIRSAEIAIHNGLRSLIPEHTDVDELLNENQVYAENSFVELLSVKTQLHERLFALSGEKSHLEGAISNINLALHANDLIRESLIGDPSKLLSIRNNKRLVQKGVLVLSQLYQLDNDEKWINLARSFFNRSKSILFDEKTLRSKLIELLSSIDKDKIKSLQKNLKELYESKYEDDADLITINGEIIAVLEKINDILNPYKNLVLELQRPVDYIEYLVTEDHIYGLSDIKGERRFLELIRPAIFQALLTRLDQYIRLKNFSSDEEVLRELYNVLIAPITTNLPDQLVIIPDEFLGYVPFEILKDNEDEYIIKGSTIAYSFAYETQKSKTQDRPKKWQVICMAPQYPEKELSDKNQTRGSIYHLPFAKIEVEAITTLYGDSAYTIPLPIEDAWGEMLNDARIFHYAGHAIVKEEKSYLALTAKENAADQVTAEEIRLMQHPLELVVLSACETGLGVLALGEGIQSLGRSFMESGAKSTVISLWNVNDKSTSQIIASFYRNLKQGLEKDESLRMAKLDYLVNAPTNLKHPFFWAPFIPAGDMSALDALN